MNDHDAIDEDGLPVFEPTVYAPALYILGDSKMKGFVSATLATASLVEMLLVKQSDRDHCVRKARQLAEACEAIGFLALAGSALAIAHLKVADERDRAQLDGIARKFSRSLDATRHLVTRRGMGLEVANETQGSRSLATSLTKVDQKGSESIHCRNNISI